MLQPTEGPLSDLLGWLDELPYLYHKVPPCVPRGPQWYYQRFTMVLASHG